MDSSYDWICMLNQFKLSNPNSMLNTKVYLTINFVLLLLVERYSHLKLNKVQLISAILFVHASSMYNVSVAFPHHRRWRKLIRMNDQASLDWWLSEKCLWSPNIETLPSQRLNLAIRIHDKCLQNKSIKSNQLFQG